MNDPAVATDPPCVLVRQVGRTPLVVVVTGSLEIGRDCDGLLVTDAQVSRRHVVLRARAGQIEVEDLGSSNGTTLDDCRLDAPTCLQPGQLLRLGSTTVELTRTTPASEPRMHGRATSIDLLAAAAAAEAAELAERRASRDSGTVTIVFSDIEGSTQQSAALGDEAWMDLLDLHNRIVRHHVGRHDGTEVKAQGDGFMLTFPGARAATLAMIDVQRALAAHARSHPGSAVRVRVGIHTGEAIVGDRGDLFGRHVNLAARVANCARGGEILVSSLVHEIIDARGDLRFDPPRDVELKGLVGTHTVHPLRWIE